MKGKGGSASQESARDAYKDAELVVGLVAPAGTNLDQFEESIEASLAAYAYQVNRIRLSSIIGRFLPRRAKKSESESERLNRLMSDGNTLRSTCSDLLALAAAHEIKRNRGGRRRVAHVVRSLKHPDEVLALRQIYGPGFFLIGVIANANERRAHLRVAKQCEDADIDALFKRDEEEDEPHGQHTRETFKLADVFLPLGDEEKLRRFLRLVFGFPFETPTRDEYAMYLAFASSLRSADLSRQVGAVIVSEAGDVLSVGANDVPQAGGGLYWPGPNDCRDYVKGEDSNERQRGRMMTDALGRLGRKLRPPRMPKATWLQRGLELLKPSRLADITEYGRAVHAEMEAVLACGRTGARTRGATLFCTTFPCHNCAKHIVAAGLVRVVYVEPYPKSQAAELFDDSITLEDNVDKVRFEPFEGIGPRRFLDLFSMRLSSGYKVDRKKDGRNIVWEARAAHPRVPLLDNDYIALEENAAARLIAVTSEEFNEKARPKRQRR